MGCGVRLVGLAVALAAGPLTPALAADFSAYDPTVSVRVGTLGIGPELSARLPSTPFGLRLNADFFDYSLTNFHTSSLSASAGPIDYTGSLSYSGTLHLASGGVVGDYYPFADKGFRLSAGLIFVGNDVTANAYGSVTALNTLNGVTASLGEGTANAKITVNPVAPYLGLGWAAHLTSSLVFSADAGVMFEGDPHVSISSGGAVNEIPGLEASLQADARKVQNDIAVPVWPVVKIGLGWQF